MDTSLHTGNTNAAKSTEMNRVTVVGVWLVN